MQWFQYVQSYVDGVNLANFCNDRKKRNSLWIQNFKFWKKTYKFLLDFYKN